MVDGTCLENKRSARVRGFESLILRALKLIAMKKSLILVLAAAAMMLAGANASAQISIGVGPATRLYFANDQDAIYGVGVQVNFEDSMRMSDWFGYSAGLDFGTYKNKEYYVPGTSLTEMYVDLPVRVKFYIPLGGDVDLFLFGGPVASVCVGSHLRAGDTKSSMFDEGFSYSRYDVLAGGGIGMEIAERFKIALGYDHGLLDRDKSSNEAKTMHVAAAKFTVSCMF